MIRAAVGLVAVSCLVVGCCTKARFPSADKPPTISVSRDEQVASWRLNGRKVCKNLIWAAPGCYVLEVDFSASYKKYRKESSGEKAVGLVSPLARLLAAEGKATTSEYSSSNIPFAVTLRENATYYVTSTFTGEEFLPRIVESNALGERIAQIDPTLDQAVLDACRQNTQERTGNEDSEPSRMADSDEGGCWL